MMHQLFIDGHLADLSDDTNVSFTIQSNLLTGAADFKGNHSLSIALPATVNNRQIINMAHVVQGGGDFPYTFHNVEYYRNGVPVITDGIGRLLSATPDKLNITIVWGVRTAVEALLGSGKSIASLTTGAGITLNDVPQVSDYADALTDDVFYAALDTELHQSENAYYHTHVTIGGNTYDYTEELSASAMLHPSVRMNWLLSLMEAQYGAHIDWGSAQDSIDTMVVPLVGKTPNDTTFNYGYSAASNGYIGNAIRLRTTRNSAIIAETTSSPSTTALTCATAFSGLVRFSFYLYINEADLVRVSYPIYKTAHGYSLGLRVSGTTHWCTIIPEGYTFLADKIVGGELAVYATGYFNIEMAVNDTISVLVGVVDNGSIDPSQSGTGGLNIRGGNLTIAQIIGSEDEVQPGQWFPVEGNLPDIKPVDLVKFLAAVTGVFPVQASTSDTLIMKPVESVFDLTRAVNWSDRVMSPTPRPVPADKAFAVDGWAQRNWWRWKEDETVSGNYDGSLDVIDETLETERDVMTFPFAATDGNNVPLYTKEVKQTQEVVYKYKAVQPRVLTLSEGGAHEAVAMFTMDMKRILADYYGDLMTTMQHPSVIAETIRISDVELAQLDETRPIYIEQHGAYFALLELTAKGSRRAEVKLLKLTKRVEEQ